MKVIVIGCGRFGIELAHRLYKRGDEVVVLDASSETFNNLPQDFDGRLVEGDAMNQDVLERAGIDDADALAVVTNNDALNLVVGRIARSVYNVPTVAARNYEVSVQELYELFNLQVISAAVWGAQRVAELFNLTEARMVYSVGNGEVTFYEVVVPAHWENKTLLEIMDCQGCQLTAVTRSGKAFIAQNDLILKSGDVLSICATAQGVQVLQERLSQIGKDI
ncbi:MAG: TrkA family potassium uptake protein [Anaerolineaceae bacterium]|nr:TrkA family potassium uptake protein [Anaerolineaceae bacterium]